MHAMQRIVCLLLVFLINNICFAFDFKQGEVPIQLGLFQAKAGMSQLIRIEGLLGNQYTIDSTSDNNGLVGIGYLRPVSAKNTFKLSKIELSHLAYGVNAFYLGKTTVNGLIVQEQAFANLSYQYNVSNLPIYAVVRGELFKTQGKNNIGLVLHAGIGPNIMMLRHYQETVRDPSTLPNHSFYSKTNTTFSAMGGVGVAIHDLIPDVHVPFECAYRFFYLGQSALNKRTTQIINSLETRNTYAQAIVCSATV